MYLVCSFTKSNNRSIMGFATDCFTVQDPCKSPEGISNHLLGGVLAFVMGIVTMVRMTTNMPRKITEAALYGSQVYYNDSMMKGGHQLPAPSISGADYMAMAKRMAELEDKVKTLTAKPTTMPPEKEEMLNAAVSRVNTLEQELSATKKVHNLYILGFPFSKRKRSVLWHNWVRCFCCAGTWEFTC